LQFTHPDLLANLAPGQTNVVAGSNQRRSRGGRRQPRHGVAGVAAAVAQEFARRGGHGV
jgi:hypothetical protein